MMSFDIYKYIKRWDSVCGFSGLLFIRYNFFFFRFGRISFFAYEYKFCSGLEVHDPTIRLEIINLSFCSLQVIHIEKNTRRVRESQKDLKWLFGRALCGLRRWKIPLGNNIDAASFLYLPSAMFDSIQRYIFFFYALLFSSKKRLLQQIALLSSLCRMTCNWLHCIECGSMWNITVPQEWHWSFCVVLCCCV